MLLGWALRTFGPRLRYQDGLDAPQGAEKIMARLSWRRFVSALGAVIVTSGVALILVTFIIILINPGDQVGSRIAWICFALIVLAVAVWLWLYVGRFGIYGILPERQQPATVFRAPVPAPVNVGPARNVGPAAALATETVVEVHAQDAWEDGEEYGPWIEDEEYADEQESRYAKYQLHHPDETVETEPYEEALPLPQSEPIDEAGDASDLPTLDTEAGDVSKAMGEVPDKEEPVVISDEPVDVPEDTLEPIPAEHAVEHSPIGEVADESSASGPDVDIVSPDEVNNAGNDSSQLLSDTPEGRAEALRRIEAWQPESPDEDEKM
jgi:hypothetical protein